MVETYLDLSNSCHTCDYRIGVKGNYCEKLSIEPAPVCMEHSEFKHARKILRKSNVIAEPLRKSSKLGLLRPQR